MSALTRGVAVLFVATLPALAQTPAQMEYERQQREYWRAQEQQREAERVRQQQQDNARRQQEEFNRSMRPSGPGSPADAVWVANSQSRGDWSLEQTAAMLPPSVTIKRARSM